MADRRRPEADESVAVEEPQELTMRQLFQRYTDEQERDKHDAERLVALREKAVESGLSAQEGMERLLLEQAREDREPRLKKFLYEAQTAKSELDIEQVVSSWDELVAQKQAAYDKVKLVIGALYEAWRGVFAVHLQQEQQWQKLPKDGSSMSTFPGGSELSQWLTSRMPQGWDGILNDPHQQVWRVDWTGVLDVDPDMKPLHQTSVGRIRDRATAWCQRQIQQVENAREAEENE